MTIFDQIKDYIAECVKESKPHDIFAIDADQIEDLYKEAIITENSVKTYADKYLPIYSLSQQEREIPGIVGKYHGVNIVIKP
jgi:ribosomal silencing factor RsfS